MIELPKLIELPNVTLVCADTRNPLIAARTVVECFKHVKFAEVIFFTDNYFNDGLITFKKIKPIKSKQEYSHFIFFDLARHINTDFVMICQHDGYIVNPAAWSPDFLKYDYIGAPWWYKDGKNVGNGGFSIRSAKLMRYISQPDTLTSNWCGYHPEDDRICRAYRRELEDKGFTFAPDDVAERFSFEPNELHPHYTGQFGFHGADPTTFNL